MAFRRRFKRSYRGSFRGRKYAGNFSRRGFSGSVGGYGLNLSTPFMAGALIGFTNMDDKIPAEITLAGASMPIKGKGFGTVKAVSQGILMGNLIQSLVKNKGLSGKGSNFGV
ncbi:MAG: hypothetical protein Q7I94_00625 [Candidatus Contubernalis sp.]|nr:hypothetical protein [Candidatus Contubernalis sp.]